jgi:hypothetical protein
MNPRESSHPIAPHGPAQTTASPPGGARYSGLVTYFDMEDLGLWWAEPIKGESSLVRGGSPTTIVIVMSIHVLMEEFLCQGLMAWRSVLECLSVRHAWVLVTMSHHARP